MVQPDSVTFFEGAYPVLKRHQRDDKQLRLLLTLVTRCQHFRGVYVSVSCRPGVGKRFADSLALADRRSRRCWLNCDPALGSIEQLSRQEIAESAAQN